MQNQSLDVVIDKGHGDYLTKSVVIKSAGVDKKKKKRPARKQAESRENGDELPPQTGTVFNIWYGKWSGGDKQDPWSAKNHAGSRCNIQKDSGYTKADKIGGAYFCLFFARGKCPHGPACTYLHRLPTVHDIYNPNVDCFGRDKHADYRDDMGGVGSFLRQNRTLYIGQITVSEEIEEVVARHFSEWGEIERIRVLNSRGIAFVTYVNEVGAQFAKEAMMHQSLDHGEVLSVRWATRDPNPMAAARDKRRVEEQAAEAIRRALPEEFLAEIEGRDPEAVKRKKVESSMGLPGYEAPDEIWYARGVDAVNPAGRVTSGKEEKVELIEAAPQETANGAIFSTDTLVALQDYSKQAAALQNTTKCSTLVAGYSSDDE